MGPFNLMWICGPNEESTRMRVGENPAAESRLRPLQRCYEILCWRWVLALFFLTNYRQFGRSDGGRRAKQGDLGIRTLIIAKRGVLRASLSSITPLFRTAPWTPHVLRQTTMHKNKMLSCGQATDLVKSPGPLRIGGAHARACEPRQLSASGLDLPAQLVPRPRLMQHGAKSPRTWKLSTFVVLAQNISQIRSHTGATRLISSSPVDKR
ncbi:hypothetical protein F4861DRAFT_127704 [Xylaria intraflava]|nr:hypothetical protein F4861DRAFT_127704 [Xylaria intraflava]